MSIHESNNTTHQARKYRASNIGYLGTKPFHATATSSTSHDYSHGCKRKKQQGYCRCVESVTPDHTTLARKIFSFAFGWSRKGCATSGSQAPHIVGQNQGRCRSHAPYKAIQCDTLEYAQHGQRSASFGSQYPPYLANAQPKTSFNRNVQTQPRQTLCREADRCCRSLFEPTGKGSGFMRRRKKPDTGLGTHTTGTSPQARNSRTTDSRLQAQRHNDLVRCFKLTRRQSDWRLHAAPPPPRVHPISQEDRCGNTGRSATSFDCGQLFDAQASTGQELVQTASTFSSSFYTDFQFLAQHGRALVPRDYRQAYQARFFFQRSAIDCGNQRVFGKSQSKSESVCLESVGRKNINQDHQM